MGINGKGIDNGLVQDRRLFVDMRMELDYVPKEIEEKWHHYWENNI